LCTHGTPYPNNESKHIVRGFVNATSDYLSGGYSRLLFLEAFGLDEAIVEAADIAEIVEWPEVGVDDGDDHARILSDVDSGEMSFVELSEFFSLFDLVLKSLNIFSLALTSRTNELFQPILMFARKA